MKVLLAHPGTQYSFQLAKQLYKRDMLFEFHTGFAFGKDSWFYSFASKLPLKLFNRISNRFIDDVPDRYIKRNSFLEITALLKLKIGHQEENVFYRRNKKFQNMISDQSIKKSDAVIGFDTSSWILAERCRQFSKNFFLDVSIAHPVSKDVVYRQLIKTYPEWKFFVKKKEYKHIAIEEAEMKLASHIIVASSFTLKTYVDHGIPVEKISINSYGVDTNSFKPSGLKKETPNPIKFVFVGSIDARKGIPLLLETWHKIPAKNIELTLIGPVSPAIEKFIVTRYPSVILKGKLSFNEVKAILPDYDVMVFPSFFEGFGLVVPEAMACGMPVITTTATCGDDIIENSRDGFIIDPGDEKKLKESIEYFIQSPAKIKEMGSSSRKKAEQFTWDAYGERWSNVLRKKMINN